MTKFEKQADNMRAILCYVLKCGYMDIEKLEEVWGEWEIVSGEQDELADYITEDGFGVNDLMYSCMSNTFHAIVSNLVGREKITEEQADELRDNFSPFLNYMDTHYNNELDNIVFEGRTLEDIADEYYESLDKEE